MTGYGSLGDLTDRQLQAALDRFGLGPLVSAEAFTVGLFGKNVGLVTDRGRWVLRGDPWPMHSDEQFRRERFWASCVRDRSQVPVPWPFHIEVDESLFGWPYQLTPWMPGRQERNEVGAAALGRAAADLRRVTFDSFGSWSPAADAIVPFDGSTTEWLFARTQVWIDLCEAQARPLCDTDLEWVRSLLPVDLHDVVPTYLHHDLKPGNCVCADDEVSGLFDLGEGTTGDPLEDLARPTWDLARHDPALVPVFLQAYEEAAGVRVPLDRLWAYVVLDLLVIWEFGTRPAQSWFRESTFTAWATSFASPVTDALAALRENR
ncbi:MAG TPA: aminoglycoside phosphotransferase family protein [Acidimicrobiales bacterium]|nr:aminoglycoside phosphotransferase family protein [Acidimicrobiales bacterium]